MLPLPQDYKAAYGSSSYPQREELRAAREKAAGELRAACEASCIADRQGQDKSAFEQAKQNLSEACKADNASRIRELFETGLLGPAEATTALEDLDHRHDLLEMRRCLLENGAHSNVAYGNLELERAHSLDLFRLLAEFGHDFGSQGHLIFHDFVDSRDILDWLLDQGVNINRTEHARSESGSKYYGEIDFSLKVLNAVAARGDIELFDHVVSRGAEPLRSIALHRVSKCKDPAKATAMISRLIDKHGMDINLDNETMREFFHNSPGCGTPLTCAIYYRNLPAVEELLRFGAHPEGQPGSNALDLVLANFRFPEGFLPALKPLLDAGARSTPALCNAAGRDHMEAAVICLEYGADPTEPLRFESLDVERVLAERELWRGEIEQDDLAD